MNRVEFGWESLLNTDVPRECFLKAALFTTYDRPEERLLVEHLLPLLLKLGREADGEGAERQYFLLELDQRLKQLHDRVIVVSSAIREEPTDFDDCEAAAYPWIWRSIRHLTVGIHQKAVQHSKLWFLHWGTTGDGDAEYIEIVVSSANLTRAAFTGQLQAAWRVCIELYPNGAKARLDQWGILPKFIHALSESAGNSARLQPFIELLSRADCPEGVTFVASVPGTHSRSELRRNPWGAAGLGMVAPAGRGAVSASILSPFIGTWNADALTRFCRAFNGTPDRLELVWIDKNHSWATQNHWIMPKATWRTLKGAGVELLHLRHNGDSQTETASFHVEHRRTDPRWSHAKVYALKRGNSHRLLVTSANFSTAAWGRESQNGELTIENFELGVSIEKALWRFQDLRPFADIEDAATVAKPPSRGSTLILWAQATWDGKQVTIRCRCEPNKKLSGKLNCDGKWKRFTQWKVSAEKSLRSARIAWVDPRRAPSFIQLTCENEAAV